MPRIARVVGVGHFHHVTQRGNNQVEIFLDTADRIYYLSLIKDYCQKYNTSVLAYCLMNNHVHFIVRPGEEYSLARTFHAAHMQYAKYFNKKTGSSGHLWQERYYSCLLQGNHLLAATRYIERNPVRANIVQYPWNWRWSSAPYHIGVSRADIPLINLFELIDFTSETWRCYISESESSQFIIDIKKRTRIGLPLGESNFVLDLERNLGRKLVPSPVGRPWLC